MISDLALLESLKELTRHHHEKCDLYRWYVDSLFKDFRKAQFLEDLPWLPVRAFKENILKSIPDNQVFKTMLSSGTQGIQSKILLDKGNAKAQQLKLIETFVNVFGGDRCPMLVIDTESTIKDRNYFSARAAAIHGFSIFSRDREFALNIDMKLDIKRVESFLERHSGQKIFIFGFTFVVFEHLIRQLERSGRNLNLTNAFLLHGGGWKKIEAKKISNRDFKSRIFDVIRCSRIHNYYGMIEQTGAIYIECEYGNMHAPNGSNFLIRSSRDFVTAEEGESGLIQIFSDIQTSYPGHSLLSEDIGISFPFSTCSCGSQGQILNVLGRAERSEVRGCSDAVN